MIKDLFPFVAVIIALFLIGYFGHNYIIELNKFTLSFSLLGVYLFHLIASLLVFSITYFVFTISPNQAGFAYLASIFLKLGFFVLIFKSSIFTEVDLTQVERVSLVIPLFVFLFSEAIGVSKLLNSK